MITKISRDRRRPTLRRAVAVLASATLLASCQPTHRGDSPDAAQRPFVAAAVGAVGDVLVFPPDPHSQPRGPSPSEVSGETTPADDIVYPSLNDDGAFSLSGRSVSVSFRRPVTIPTDATGSLVIDPPVAGKTTWNSDWSVTFEADEHFDPKQVYTLSIGALADTDGKAIGEEFAATFTARPELSIAGKLIHYFPEAGKPKLVTMQPWDGARVGTNSMISVLFDQAVSGAALKPRITLRVDGTVAAAVLSHPKQDRYDGIAVDKDFVLEIRPSSKIKPGSTLQVEIAGPDPADDSQQVRLDVAETLRFTTVGCGWGDDSGCLLKAGELHLPTRDFTIRLNNPIEMDEKALVRAVKISPKVRNLSIWSDRWSDEGRIHVSGDFSSSKTYHVNVGTLKDRFGGRLRKTVAFDLIRPAQSASVSMAEGVVFADAKSSRTFAITTRNVERAKLVVWEVAATAAAQQRAQQRLSSREAPPETPDAVIMISPRARRDKTVTSTVNLLDHLTPGKSYLAMLQLHSIAFGAPKPSYPTWSLAARSTMALITPHDDDAIVMHGHASGGETLVHVARLSSGKPLAGAKITIDAETAGAVFTDAQGLAVLPTAPRIGHPLVLTADHKGDVAELALGSSSLSAGHIAPELTGGTSVKGNTRALIITDRGAYRPGATVRIKASLRERQGSGLRPLSGQSTRVRVVDPTGKEALSTDITSDAMGGVATDFDVSTRAAIGRYRIIVGAAEGSETYAEQTIQVAEFEPPRFSVDVALSSHAAERVQAEIEGKYLFGAPMDGAKVTWTLRRGDAPIPNGSLMRRGLKFRAHRSWYDEETDAAWTRTGSGSLSPKGVMGLRQAVEMPSNRGPQRFTLEAEVADVSHRSIAGRGSVVLHSAEVYAGIKVKDHWLPEGKPVPFEVGVIDHGGAAVAGKTIRVELTRERWVRTRKSGPSGSFRSRWHVKHEPAGSCTTNSAGTPSTCALVTKGGGDYRVTVFVDGKAGGSDYLWAWGGHWDSAAPTKGRTLQVSSDKQSYKPGDTAKIIVASPFPKATAIVTLDDGGLVRRQVHTVTGRAASFELEIPKNSDGPWVHATVTLLPRGAKGSAIAEWKLGAIRLPLQLADVALDVTAVSDKDAYQPGEHVELDIDVTRNGKPAANAEVVLAIVDEGVLRLTNHHAPDPVPAMHPGRPLAITIDDNRRAFAELLGRSHTGGDGPGSGAQSLVGARKKFVRTALWKPGLRTDAQGHIDVGFELPDNLTRFRIMAVALDAEGRGGSVEDGFFVRKSLMIQPAVPRFATVGDRFEAAVLVHNNTDSDETTTVTLGKRSKEVALAANSRARVAFSIHPRQAGVRRLVFTVKDTEGEERDRVVAKIPVQAPGLDERPHISGSFLAAQEIRLEVPQGVEAGTSGDDFLTVTLGEQLWPELAGRLDYLIDYPHGCVEQTTSSTVPLLAARTMLPRLGVSKWSTKEIDAMIVVGVNRLDSMRTTSGGLAYWPGGHEPNLYGTAYAMNAVVGAKAAGIKLPDGLLSGMQDYLVAQLLADQLPWGSGPEVRAAVALSLANAEALPDTAADALFDTKDKQGPFGLAALAIALSSTDGNEDRVGVLVDALEARLDDEGSILGDSPENEFHYFGSTTRTRALAAMALGRLRPQSGKVPGLIHRLLQAPEGYTTQSTAYALLSLTEHIARQQALATDHRVRALLDGIPVEALLGEATEIAPGAMQYKIPLARVRGHVITLRLEAESDESIGYAVSGRWRRPVDAPHSRSATTGARAPDIWRVVTDVEGKPVDLNAIEAGTTLRVVLLARLPRGRVEQDRMGYLALTDRLPAGFEALQPDLWTVAAVPNLSDEHPLSGLIAWGSDASHVELRDDRALFYFDRVWGDYVHATYLMRATTPGRFSAAPASAELMYETDGIGLSEGLSIQVKR